nr:hypothetical protein [Tanacetum cinerariifolium]
MADVNAPSSQAPAMAPPLDEQWFVLTKDTLREALQITPVNNNQAFTAPPTSEGLINFRALLTIINLCLMGKTSGFERPRAPVLQILWGIVKQDNIDYAERIWEEFVQSIYTFIKDKQNLSRHTTGKKRAPLIMISSIRFTKLIIHHLQRRHKFHPRPDSPLHLPNEEPVLGYLKFSAKEYLASVAKYRRYLAGEIGSVQDSPTPKPIKPARKPKTIAPKAPPRPLVSIPVTSAQPAPTSAPAKPQEKKRKQATKTSDKPPKVKKSKYGWVSKKRTLKYVATSEAEDVLIMEPQVTAEDAELQKVLEESMKTAYATAPRGPLPPVVIREPESGKYQPLPEVPGKGKAKVTEEQVAHDLLSLQKPKKKSPADQYIFQRRVFEPTGSSEHDESLYVMLGQSDSEEESEKVMIGADEGGQSERQAGLDPGQAGPNPGDAGAEVQSIPSPVVHAGLDRKHMDLDVADVSPQPSTEQLDEGFTATAYQRVQENLKLVVEEHVLLEEPASSSGTLSSLQHLSKDISFRDLFFSDKPSDVDKNAKTKVESMVNFPIQQALSSISLMTSPIIDLTLRPESPKRIGELKHIMTNLIQVNKDIQERLDKHGARLYTLKQLDIPITDEQSYLAEARKKKKKSRESPKTSPGSPPHHPPPPPLPAGPSEASGAPGAFGSSQVPPPPPPPPSSTNQESSSKGSATPSSSQTAASAEYQAWTITDIRLRPSISLTLADLEMDEDMDWWKPLEEERPAMPEPAWSIPSSDVPVPPNIWASRVDDPILKHNVSKPLPLGGPPGQVTIQFDFFFNKDLEYLRYGSKGSRPALSISKMKAAYYSDAGLEQMVPDQFWIDEECKYDIAVMYGISHWWFQRQRFYIDQHTSEGDRSAVRTHMRILSVVRIEVFSMYGYDYMKKIVLRRADLNEHVIAERDFKYLYPSDFEDFYLLKLQEDFQLGIESYQTQLNLTKPQWVATGFEYKHDYTVIKSPRAVIFWDKYRVQMMMRFNEIHKFSDGTLQQIDEALDYRVKEFRINRMNPEAFEDKADLPQPGELCWWTRQRGRLQTFEAYRMIKSFRHSRPLFDDL